MTATKAIVPGVGSLIERPEKGTPRDELPVLPAAERADPREQLEVDREAVAVPEPGLGAERRRAQPRDHAVDRDRQRERVRVGGVHVRQLHRREREQQHGGRPAAEPLRVLERRPVVEPEPPHDPARAVRGRPPRAQHRPDVPEQDDDEHQPDPEIDVDEGRSEVDAARVLPDQRAEPEEDEQGERGGAGDDPQRGGEEHALQRGRQRPAGGPHGEQRLLPEHGERDERDDEHAGRAVEEDVPRDREVANPPDPVEPGASSSLTVSSDDRSLRLSSSASKTPVMLAAK